jgi:outer membrane lipoprotein-sorting protein
VKQRMCLKLAICSLLVLIVAPGFAVQPPQSQPFSADMTVTTGKGGENVTGKVYFSLPKTRMDMTAHGQNMSMITNSSTQTSYMVMHQQHMYMEMHANQNNPMTRNMPKIDGSFDPQNPCGKQADVTCKKAGTETVNGRVCDKWVTTDKNGKTSTAWVDQKLYFPIKVLSAEGATMELTNVKEGAQPASTFEVPVGYRKMDLGGMMGGGKPPQ